MDVRTEKEWVEILKNAPYGIIPGTAEEILDQGKKILRYLCAQEIIKDGDHVLDLGCGKGRMAIALSSMNVRYDGIDIVTSCIDFCRRVFSDCPNFLFKLLNVRNRKYRKYALWSPRRVRFPYPDETFDTVIAISVFTHIGDERVRDRYLAEMYRVLKKGGQAYVTWFKSPPNDCCNDDERTVFTETDIRHAVRKFEIIDVQGCMTKNWHDQWMMHLKKKV